MTEVELLRGVLRHTAAQRCELAQQQTWPATPAISVEIENNECLDSQVRARLAELRLQQNRGPDDETQQ